MFEIREKQVPINRENSKEDNTDSDTTRYRSFESAILSPDDRKVKQAQKQREYVQGYCDETVFAGNCDEVDSSEDDESGETEESEWECETK